MGLNHEDLEALVHRVSKEVSVSRMLKEVELKKVQYEPGSNLIVCMAKQTKSVGFTQISVHRIATFGHKYLGHQMLVGEWVFFSIYCSNYNVRIL